VAIRNKVKSVAAGTSSTTSSSSVKPRLPEKEITKIIREARENSARGDTWVEVTVKGTFPLENPPRNPPK